MAKLELNEKNIKGAQPGDVLRDTLVKGLELHVLATCKSFKLYYRTKAGKERRPKLGDFGDITLAQARKAAQALLAEVALGKDPSQANQAARAEATLKDLWDKFWTEHAQSKKSGSQDKWVWTKLVEPKLGSRKLSELDYDVLAGFMKGEEHRPVAANRAMALISTMFQFAIGPFKMFAGESPTKPIKRYPENKRRRYMALKEAQAIARELNKEARDNPASVSFIQLLILSGARRGEIAKATWSQLHGNRLILDEHKTDGDGELRIINLPEAAMEVLAMLPRTEGTITGIKNPSALWQKIRTAAGCPDLRLHDLRHSFASAAIEAGLTLEQIGELLGHKDPTTTKRYSHLMDEAAAAATSATADVIASRMKPALALAA
jgi:integrase